MVCNILKQFNGVVYYDVKPVQAELHLDSCLKGFGDILTISVMLFPYRKILITTPMYIWGC